MKELWVWVFDLKVSKHVCSLTWWFYQRWAAPDPNSRGPNRMEPLEPEVSSEKKKRRKRLQRSCCRRRQGEEEFKTTLRWGVIKQEHIYESREAGHLGSWGTDIFCLRRLRVAAAEVGSCCSSKSLFRRLEVEKEVVLGGGGAGRLTGGLVCVVWAVEVEGEGSRPATERRASKSNILSSHCL